MLSDSQGKSANLKSALKKQAKVKRNVHSLVWADQNKFNAAPDIGKTGLKVRASNTDADETPNFVQVREHP